MLGGSRGETLRSRGRTRDLRKKRERQTFWLFGSIIQKDSDNQSNASTKKPLR